MGIVKIVKKVKNYQRKVRLTNKLTNELDKPEPKLEDILKCIDTYEQDNLATIKKLKRKRSVESKKISGALKDSINAHGPITKLLIGSATKRVVGSLLVPEQNLSFWRKIKNKFKNKL